MPHLSVLRSVLLGRRTSSAYPPIVIGATGGSGSRVFREVLQRSGVFMGRRLNESGDAMDFEPFLDAYINRLLEAVRRLDYRFEDLPRRLGRGAVRAFEKALATFQADMDPGAGWGWKNPRSMYVLPIIHRVFPDIRFVHVIRDGRDMALSVNQNQLRKHGGAFFGVDSVELTPSASAALWSAANLQVAAWGEETLKDNYVRLRLEDVCADPLGNVATLIDRFDLPIKDPEYVAAGVHIPQTLGRWRSADPALVAEISGAAQPGLSAFGYLPRTPGGARPEPKRTVGRGCGPQLQRDTT